jgi:hypothetical protein
MADCGRRYIEFVGGLAEAHQARRRFECAQGIQGRQSIAH